MVDSIPDSSAFRIETPSVSGFYSLHPDSNSLLFSAIGTPRSITSSFRWKEHVSDVYEIPLFADSVEPDYKKNDHNQLSRMENRYIPIYSPDGSQIASIQQIADRAHLSISRDSGKTWVRKYPNSTNDSLQMHSIYSIDWSSDGSKIAFGYLDQDHRKVGYYDLELEQFFVVANDGSDSRDPRFSNDSKRLYFASNRSNTVFNIFRYNIETASLDQVTNTVGGAFAPDISNDETRLLYATYTKDGYAIYLDDSVSVLATTESELTLRDGLAPDSFAIGGVPEKYNSMPRKLMVIPTIISEEVLTENNDAFSGVRQTKSGAIIGLVDPLSWRGIGNNVMFFFLTESYFKQISDIIKDRSLAKRYATDFGVFGSSNIFAFNIGATYFRRNIPSVSQFVHNSYGYQTVESTNYSVQPSMVEFSASYPAGLINVKYYISHFNFRLQIGLRNDDDNERYLNYDPSKNFRHGLILSHTKTKYSISKNISPHRTVAKLQYEMNYGKYVDPDEPLDLSGGEINENYDYFDYHIFKGVIRRARPSLLNPKIDFEWGIHGSYLAEARSSSSDNPFPQLYTPAIKVPGYAYFYQADSNSYQINPDPDDLDKFDTIYIANDTVLAAGKAIVGSHASFRFPLWPGSIEKKIGFIYLDQLYGAVNGGGVLTANSGSDLLDKTADDWLMYAGLETRLSTIAFNSYNLAFKLRWDYGFNRDEPVGGSRFLFALGFEFDNWTIVTEPDGIEGRFRPSYIR